MFVPKLYNNLNSDSRQIIQNNKIKIELKEHQKTAIYAMLDFEETGTVSFIEKGYIRNYNIYHSPTSINTNTSSSSTSNTNDINIEIETNYSILADKVGSGKTYMIMGMICHNQIPKERATILNSSIYTVIKYKTNDITIKTNLIIVPHNLTLQWKQTFMNCSLKTYVISKKSEIDFLVFDNNNENIRNIKYYDCIIISSTMVHDFLISPQNISPNCFKFSEIKWARIIIDEIVSIKLPISMEFNCNFIWFITATPYGIKDIKRTYIKILTNSISTITLDNITIKNNDDYVNNSMSLPNLNKIIIKCLTPHELRILKDYVNEEIITMINAGNLEGAIKKLNCNIDTTENILDVLTRKMKIELHNIKQELIYETNLIPDNVKTHKEKINKINERINTLEIRCSSISDKIKDYNDCPICYNSLVSPILAPCCNNLFCIECLIKCKICPMCRTLININKCTVINPDLCHKHIVPEEKLHSKIDNLIKLLKLKPNGKFLLFSEYDKTFDNLNVILNNNNITHGRLVGSSVIVNNIIKKFDSGNINVLMLNASNYGSGLNLQMATDIIIYHELKIELETQVIGRAQRLGRTLPLNVYYLFNETENKN
jgi:hypothetical protein